MTDLAAIVARDREWAPTTNGSWTRWHTPSDGIRQWMEDAISDRRALLALLRETREAQRAIGGFLWLGNNLHNIKASPVEFQRLYEVALEDAQPVFNWLERTLVALTEPTP